MTVFTYAWRAGADLPPRGRDGEPRSIAAILSGRADAPGRRTGQPVRRNSFDRDDRRLGAFWRPVARSFQRQHLRAAEEFDRATRQPGCRNGALGHVGLEIARYLFRKVSWRTGQLDPAIATIMAAVNRSRDAVCRALRALREYGFLEWMRRTEPIEDAHGPGPRVRQTSNAYRLTIPRKLLARFRRPAPPPDDETQRQADAVAETARCVAQLDDAAWIRTFVADPGLKAALLALERAVAAK